MTNTYAQEHCTKILFPKASTAWLLLLIAAGIARADWPNTNETKYVQFPDRKGYDVLAAANGICGRRVVTATARL